MQRLLSMLYPGFPGGRTGIGLLVLRVVAGLAFMFHGWGKVQSPFGWMGPESSIPGFLQGLAAVSEFFGGLGWILGLLMPLSSLGILCTMLVATSFHISMGGPFVGPENAFEPALGYVAVAILFLLLGPGRYSLDAFLFGRGREER